MIRVYKYGLLPPIDHAETVQDQMRAGHRYRNTLTEIERGRRAALREIDRSIPEVAAQEALVSERLASLTEATGAVTAARSEARSRAETAAMRELVRERRASIKEAERELRETRRATFRRPTTEEKVKVLDLLGEGIEPDRIAAEVGLTLPVVQRAIVDHRALVLAKSARAHCGAYWGTYLLAEDAIDRARKAPLYDGAEPNDPRFRPWLGDAQIGVQLQGGLSAVLLDGDDTRLRIGPPRAPAGWEHRRHGRPWDPAKASAKARTLYLRVGSDDKGGPIFAAWPMVLHRPIPASATIKRATVSLRHYGPRAEWTVELTLDLPDETRSESGGAVAIDLGWRLVQGGLRVATWRASDGKTGELVLPDRLTGAIEKASELRSLRDDLLNAAREKFCAALEAIDTLPEWLLRRTRRSDEPASRAQAIAAIRQWRAAARFAALARAWRTQRFAGDETAYAELEAWRYRDHHLLCWEAGARRSSLRWRREIYRGFAAALARDYGTIVLEEMDLRRFAERPKVAADDDTRQNETARGNRHAVALSELRLSLANASGATVVTVSAVDTTRTCHACGVVVAWRSADHLHHGCSACGAVWDQDENAAANLLERWSATQIAGTARDDESIENLPAKRETKWERIKREKGERDTAREPIAKVAEGE